MSQSPAQRGAAPEPATPEPGWARPAPTVGYVGAASLGIGTLLLLADELDLLADSPDLLRSAAGPEVDRARWYAAFFGHQHDILWSIVLRDALFPVAFLSLMVLALAIASRAGWWRPSVQVTVLLTVVGGVLVIANDMVYLGQVEYWRHDSWSADPPERMNEVGRAAEAVTVATTYLEVAGELVLAGGLATMAMVWRRACRGPAWLARALVVEAAALALLALGIALELDGLQQLSGLVAGLLLGPFLLVVLGRRLGVEPAG
jgi:hypothetical protein